MHKHTPHYSVRLVPWLDVPLYFSKVDWRELKSFTSQVKFIRVEGQASANEAADVVTAIAKFRAKSDAFVITNAVQVEGANIMQGVTESLEEAKSFDVIGAILEMLDERERSVVRKLLEGTDG